MYVDMDFSTAKDQDSYKVIPDGTLLKVKLDINPGYYNDTDKGWTGDWASEGRTGAVFIKTVNTIIDGEYEGRKIYNLIGLHSPKGEEYKEMGRTLIKAILDSAYGLDPQDKSPETCKKRTLKSYSDLIGLIYGIEVKVGQNHNGEPKNEIKKVITPKDIRYRELMGDVSSKNIEDEVDDEIPF